jgi:protein tyrosine phosphatase (PTP) superfamily phosphohydrolase (DUF442 family)
MIRKIVFFSLIAFGILLAVYGYFTITVHPVIQNKIYRSAQLSGTNLQKNIKKHQFKSIINLRGKDLKEEWYQTENKIAKNNNVNLYNVRLSAYKLPVSSEVDALVHILKTAEKPLLLHCQAGADRSGMASALALSIERNASLQEMKKQFSWKYFANPFRTKSSGKLFFSAYEDYLHQTGTRHSRNILLSWIKNAYIDYKGNIEFVIEYAGKERFEHSHSEDRRSVALRKNSDGVLLTGWAFDYRRKMPIKYFSLSIDGNTYNVAHFNRDRPDVGRYYNLEKKELGNFRFGWVVNMDIKQLKKGSYKISLRVGDSHKSSSLIEDTGYDLFLK